MPEYGPFLLGLKIILPDAKLDLAKELLILEENDGSFRTFKLIS